ncbi:MAG: nicotinate-nucleotide--dimethylbenzimidazole phosphoribosyltransferase [Megasphaera sp.]|jgi:nicotinate-nucleotide--dimethylbenzimidazole phosphoribosyltransferase|nr:nicotinate-nucleotide--dimethylbenzimidazole phosphoribosyltransferase [Megasphaera sp.]MCI1248812.1 nicotinate-nucleotide--dimethylbenzimidazole phosphoribosyltransferase [Megasphaera sp.]
MTFQEKLNILIDDMAKPPDSLGLLEKQARQVFTAWGCFDKKFNPKHIIFGADNGIVRAGVVSQIADITYMQCRHMEEGTSAVTCFCQVNAVPWEVVDVGIDSADAVGIDRKIARGTKNFMIEPAMTETELKKAFSIGQERVMAAKAAGYNFLSFGEMGIGNTTTSAAVLTAIAPRHSTFLTGYGSAKGNFKLLLHKRRIIRDALHRYAPYIHSAADALRYVGGFDLAALCGAMMACAEAHIPFYIDGFITAVALACAIQLQPPVQSYALPSHLSREPGMCAALHLCGIDEYDVPIHADMCLGEGTGAVLGVVLLRSMLYAVWHMSTLSGITREAEHHQKYGTVQDTPIVVNQSEMNGLINPERTTMDETLRKQAVTIFENMGLTEEEAVTLFYKRTIAAGRMPFGPAEPKKEHPKKKRMNERMAEWDAF